MTRPPNLKIVARKLLGEFFTVVLLNRWRMATSLTRHLKMPHFFAVNPGAKGWKLHQQLKGSSLLTHFLEIIWGPLFSLMLHISGVWICFATTQNGSPTSLGILPAAGFFPNQVPRARVLESDWAGFKRRRQRFAGTKRCLGMMSR